MAVFLLHGSACRRRAATDQSDANPGRRAGWLRAAVLGADDGIVSTAALIVGVAASNASPRAVVTAGLAGLVAGAASMAAGEYVSVSSQRDLEQALYRREKSLAQAYPDVALTELAIALQLAAPDALRGRVLSLYTWVYFGLFPIGAFLIGAMSERWGVSRALFVAGLFGLATLAVVGGWWRRGSAG